MERETAVMRQSEDVEQTRRTLEQRQTELDELAAGITAVQESLQLQERAVEEATRTVGQEAKALEEREKKMMAQEEELKVGFHLRCIATHTGLEATQRSRYTLVVCGGAVAVVSTARLIDWSDGLLCTFPGS